MSAEADRTRETGGAGGCRGDPCRILVIDDEEGIHRSLERILSRQGHHVDGVLSAPEGLELLKRETYDLVITDLMMPELTGIQILERVRDLKLDVPVMMITGYPSMRTAVQALRLGAVDYLAKPFTRRELLGPVNRILRGPAEAPEEAPPALEPAAADAAPTNGRLEPGARFHLRKHSWMVCEEAGTVQVGIEASFLEGAGTIIAVELPEEADPVEQGLTGIRLKTEGDEEHGVFMPLSGQVVAVNVDAAARPGSIDADTWLVRLMPTNADAELGMLLQD